LRDTVSLLFFELSNRNQSQLVENIGYGYAAGFLASFPDEGGIYGIGKKLPLESSSSKINPVTGQDLDAERRDRLETTSMEPEMTEQEKEEEAERLFVLFDRLNRTGVVKVQNPARI
jgi:hypothetical protein